MLQRSLYTAAATIAAVCAAGSLESARGDVRPCVRASPRSPSLCVHVVSSFPTCARAHVIKFVRRCRKPLPVRSSCRHVCCASILIHHSDCRRATRARHVAARASSTSPCFQLAAPSHAIITIRIALRLVRWSLSWP
ncbi:hypothetical protein EON66_04570 [archaeon]|nr:MAG: hypothetical protein EON66_04570 [archaeon]